MLLLLLRMMSCLWSWWFACWYKWWEVRHALLKHRPQCESCHLIAWSKVRWPWRPRRWRQCMIWGYSAELRDHEEVYWENSLTHVASKAFPQSECWHHRLCRQKMIETIQKEQIQAFSTGASCADGGWLDPNVVAADLSMFSSIYDRKWISWSQQYLLLQ